MNDQIGRTKIVLFAIVLSYMGLILFLAYFQVVEAEELVKHPYNNRGMVDESKIDRGTIYDRKGNIIAESYEDEMGMKVRYYPHGSLFAHVVGYSSSEYGKTALESSYNNDLLNISAATPLDELKKILVEDTRGNDLITTLDLELQYAAKDLMEGHKGSIIVMNPQTGEVYSMFSAPYFDPNGISENWEYLISDEDSPLLNRSTQGLYTPGSVIKVLTGVAIMESDLDEMYMDQGYIEVDGYRINNFENRAPGEINMKWALVQSSNTYFVDKALQLGPAPLEDVFNRFMFGKEIPFDTPVEVSIDPFQVGMGDSALAAASYGQGTTLVTPLEMAMSISAIANDGEMVRPYLVSQVVGKEGPTFTNTPGDAISKATSEEIAQTMQGYLAAVVDNYSTAQTYGFLSGGKTGTAETGSGLTHAWYIGFGPLEDPQFAVAVILEEDGTLGGQTAAPIAASMLQKAYDLIDTRPIEENVE